MKIMGGILGFLFCAAVGVAIPRTLLAIDNQRSRSFVETHSCRLISTETNRTVVTFGFVIHMADQSYYHCDSLGVGVIVDGRPAEAAR